MSHFFKALGFDPSTDVLSDKIIGEFFNSNKKPEIDVEDLILNGRNESIEVSFAPLEAVVLKNKDILSINFDENCLVFLDRRLNLIQKIEKINGEEFKPNAICVDHDKSRIYIADQKNDQVIMTNFEFEKVKSIGKKGSGNEEFNTPWGLCFHDGLLYVSDMRNERVLVFTKDLLYLKSLKLDFYPWSIKASNEVISIESGRPPQMKFYSIKDLSFRTDVDHEQHEFRRLSEINSSFYEYNRHSNKIICFDKYGNFTKEFIVKGVSTFSSHDYDGCLFQLNESVMMTSYSNKKFIIFSKK